MSKLKSNSPESGLVDESPYQDARSTNASSEDVKKDGFTNALQSHNPYVEEETDPYVDAYSMDADHFFDAYDMQEASGDSAALKESYHRSGSEENKSNTYFVLEEEKQVDSTKKLKHGSKPHLVSQGPIKAKVRIAEKLKIFGGNKKTAPPVQHILTADNMPSRSPKCDVYDIPKIHGTQVSGSVSSGSNSETNATDESKQDYEISFIDDILCEGDAAKTNGVKLDLHGKPQVKFTKDSTANVYELAQPFTTDSETLLSSVQSSHSVSSGSFVQCKQGVVRVGKTPLAPSQQEIEEKYDQLHFHRQERHVSDAYDSLQNLHLDPSTNEPIYDRPWPSDFGGTDTDSLHSSSSDDGWGSEFDNDEGYEAEPDTPAPTKPLPLKPGQSNDGNFFRGQFKNQKSCLEEVDTICLPVQIDPSKHPPPKLPPLPDQLSENQRKCRCVIELTINSESSYIESLERIINVYEKPILDFINNAKSSLRVVFKETREILSHHRMFQIELAEWVAKWDEEERIGDIFTASFSKSMLVDAYSLYVNNFAAGMEEIRNLEQSRPSFEEFLRAKERAYPDRLSIFGLMVKPVQRFPQFIMLLQDLIKYTPQTHHDRRALQLALTELESVAHKLNERKRFSEQYFQAKQTMHNLLRQHPSQYIANRSIDFDKSRRLIRSDNFHQIDGEMESMMSRQRRLILMDDLILCVKVGVKEQDGYELERYKLKWAAKLTDVELKESSILPETHSSLNKMDATRLHILSAQLGKNLIWYQVKTVSANDLENVFRIIIVFCNIATEEFILSPVNRLAAIAGWNRMSMVISMSASPSSIYK